MKTKLTKMIMSSVAFACASLCLAAAMAQGTFATVRSVPDTQVCSVGMLRGLYLSSWDGYANVGGNLVPKAVMEGKRFNGDGTFSNDFGTVNVGGTTIINTTGGVGTYTVAADCTGTASVPNGPSFNLYVGPGAHQLWFTQTAGGLGVGTMTRLP
jgi:hypothetical protein